MEEINQKLQYQTDKLFGLAIHIEGDKTGFVSKAAIEKFKTTIKLSQQYNLEELVSKYIKPEFQLTQVSRTETKIKFKLVEKQKQPDILNDSKQKLKEKLREKYYTRTNSSTKETKYSIGQEKSSDMIKDVMKLIQEKYPSHRIIDITNVLNPDSYVEYQKANYFTNIVMVAERTESNEQVFVPRSNSEKSNIMVMSQGSFRTFNYDLVNLVIDSVVEIIKNK
jgi:hypothetical protein